MNDKPSEIEKKPAEDNPWYKLMTWYGEPASAKSKVISKNRLFWHRYMYEKLTEEDKKHLVDNNIHTKEELQLFSEEEKKDNKQNFQSWGFNPSDYDENGMGNIYFSNMIFKKDFNISQFILPSKFICMEAEFSRIANFTETTFSEEVDFTGTNFPNGVSFTRARFLGFATFTRAIIKRAALITNATFSNLVFFTDTIFSTLVDFKGARFLKDVSFRDSTFDQKVDFTGTTFSAYPNFNNVEFSSEVTFNNATFSSTTFIKTKFQGDALFKNAEFTGYTNFENAEFDKKAVFKGSSFLLREPETENFLRKLESERSVFPPECVIFKETKFTEKADFTRAVFSEDATFELAIFRKEAQFTKATFEAKAEFTSAEFNGPTIFTSIKFEEDSIFHSTIFDHAIDFRNTKFKSTTDFTNTYFKTVPQFQGSELHVDTIWDKNPDLWPKPPDYINDPKEKDKEKQKTDSADQAETAERIWSSLKFQMSRLMRHDDELFFFAKELEARAVVEGKTIPYRFYKISSDLGRSIGRPAIILLAMLAVFTLIYTLILSLTKEPSLYVVSYDLWLESLKKAFKISLVNSVPFVGLQNYVYETGMSVYIFVLGIFQSLSSAAMLFLIGLGIRNRFRIK